jgi:hypothetical protein
MMCRTCGTDPCVNPSFCAACRKADRKTEKQRPLPGIPPDWDTISLDALWQRLQQDHPTPQVTIEAIMLGVRERGLAALKEPANIERLLPCDAHAKKKINLRIVSLLAAKETAA